MLIVRSNTIYFGDGLVKVDGNVYRIPACLIQLLHMHWLFNKRSPESVTKVWNVLSGFNK